LVILKKIKSAIYSLYLTNKYGFILSKHDKKEDKLKIRGEYCEIMLDYLNIKVNIQRKNKFLANENYLILINHRGVLDPLIVEIALKENHLVGDWVSKIELAKSPFFRKFVNNAGAILVDRNSNNNKAFFNQVKSAVLDKKSIYMFPEGTRNKTTEVLGDFKGGANLIALRNKLDILPIYIKTNSGELLNNYFNNNNNEQIVDIIIGDVIPYKERDIKGKYMEMFNIK